jgi:MOSC domain-containing protein YiiM
LRAGDGVDSGLVQIQTANELLLKHKKLIDDIYHQSHVPEKHFKRLYLYSIERLAIWVQNLPASQFVSALIRYQLHPPPSTGKGKGKN